MQVTQDLMGFKARTMMPPDDIAIVEGSQPGFVAQRIRIVTSYVYGRLRKRYAIPFGLSMGTPTAQGTSPPAVIYAGVPLVGSFELVLWMVIAGAIGTAAFEWSVDGGVTRVSDVSAIAVEEGGSGYGTPPAVSLSPPDLPWGIQATATASLSGGAVSAIAVADAGSGYLNPPTVSLSGGGGAGAAASASIAPTQVLTAASVAIPGTGLNALFPALPYALDNVYVSAPPVPEVVQGWIATLVTVDVFQRRGVNPQDPQLVLIAADRDRVLAELKEAADSKDGLFDLPTNDETGTTSAVSSGGPMGYSETSPYVWTDIEANRASLEDGLGRGSGGCP